MQQVFFLETLCFKTKTAKTKRIKKTKDKKKKKDNLPVMSLWLSPYEYM